MKNKIRYIHIIAAGFIVLLFSCAKGINGRTDVLAPLAPAKTDINAGDWKTILLAGPTDFPVAAPTAVTSTAYIAELNEIKALQNAITPDQQTKISYWNAGSTLRWNELLRQLVAKYNLPPYQNADGTYPFPNANNPFAYPLFPFANPPYAARAYAYVSAARSTMHWWQPGITKGYIPVPLHIKPMQRSSHV